MNAITYKEAFSLIEQNKMWLGTINPVEFTQPNGKIKKVLARWFTNLDHGIRHEKMILDTMANNLRFNKTLRKKLSQYGVDNQYPTYDNYNAIEIPTVKCIPSDYNGVMGVPISFLDKYNPEQFEILGEATGRKDFDKRAWPTIKYQNAKQYSSSGKITNGSKANTGPNLRVDNPQGTYYTADNIDYKIIRLYARILIKAKH